MFAWIYEDLTFDKLFRQAVFFCFGCLNRPMKIVYIFLCRYVRGSWAMAMYM